MICTALISYTISDVCSTVCGVDCVWDGYIGVGWGREHLTVVCGHLRICACWQCEWWDIALGSPNCSPLGTLPTTTDQHINISLPYHQAIGDHHHSTFPSSSISLFSGTNFCLQGTLTELLWIHFDFPRTLLSPLNRNTAKKMLDFPSHLFISRFFHQKLKRN